MPTDCCRGNSLEVSDGESALLGGTKTWIRLPRDQWPKEWETMQDPVCPLVLALYEHPDAGGFWEQHCEAQLKKVGFVPIPDWPSVFRHPALRTFLVVYVDDFKQSGPSASLAEGWRLISSVITWRSPVLSRDISAANTSSDPPPLMDQTESLLPTHAMVKSRSISSSTTNPASCKHVWSVTLNCASPNSLRPFKLSRPKASPSLTKTR